MALRSRLRAALARARTKVKPGGTGMGPTGSRPVGGVAKPEAPDTHSTTGTTPSGTFVGRAGGDDAGSAEPDGAEIRARERARRQANDAPEQPGYEPGGHEDED